ncbi:MAG: DUF2147 domain-containing protein [Bacteroidetes bacterium]|nr:MAG: DUF2147 domain-containing protein [Bacteroidota bacterium]TAG90128.1 MAG: DUF2147 domain-containing protein [Bacteroidota bacterium]
MKIYILITLLACFNLIFGANAQEMVGEWKTIDDDSGKAKSIIKIYKARNGKYYGEVTKLLDKSKGENPLCTKCTDERKNKPILNMLILNDMQLIGGQLSGGKILDPEKGKEYTCKIWLEGNNLKVRGYWGVFYRTQTWYKIS